MKKTEINIGDMMKDLADYLGVDQYKLETAIQRLVEGK